MSGVSSPIAGGKPLPSLVGAALVLLQRASDGLRSDILAERLHTSHVDVDAALLPLVDEIGLHVTRTRAMATRLTFNHYRLMQEHELLTAAAVAAGVLPPPAGVSADEKDALLGPPPAPLSLEQPEEGDFDCALSTAGVLTIDSHDTHLRLSVAHTRKLLGYLDRVLGASASQALEETLA